MENNVTTRKEGGLPSTALYEGDAHAGFENVKLLKNCMMEQKV
jgi:hypothetical protein